MTDDEFEDAVLFDLVPEWRSVRRGVTARRTERHRFLITIGMHPLTLALRRVLRIHWRASRNPVRGNRVVLPTCGTCVHLGYLDRLDGPRSPMKCWFNLGERVTRGDATTVRRWWPACVDYEEGDRRDGESRTPTDHDAPHVVGLSAA